MCELPPENSPEQTKPEQPPTNIGDKIDVLITALVDINKANRDADAANEETRNRHENRMFKLERAGVIGLAIYCFFTALEWHTFNCERQTMEKELQASDDQRVMEERAWICLDKPDTVRPFSKERVVFLAKMLNTGKTPAMIDKEIVQIWSYDHALSKSNLIWENISGSGIIAPNIEYPFTFSETIGTNMFASLVEGKTLQLFSINIQYHDVFNKPRHTQDSFILKGFASNNVMGWFLGESAGGAME